jgi:prepilin-type processing-associated H-X9-DG protein
MFLVVASGQEKLMRGGGMMMRRGNEPLWVPMTQTGNRWAIDLATLSKTLFTKVAADKDSGDCFHNLRQLVLALKAFANDDDDGKFPAKLSKLVEDDYVTDLKVFIAPKSATKIQDADEVDAKSDFTYEGAGKADDGDGDTIIIYDKAGAHDGKGRHVGFADGHVQWMEESAFKKALEAQRTGNRRVAPPHGGFVPPNRGGVPMPMPEPVPMPPDNDDAPQAVPGGPGREIPPMEIQPMPARPRR